MNKLIVSAWCLHFISAHHRDRLQVDLAMIWEFYERRDVSKIIWIKEEDKLGDDVTKSKRRAGTLAEIVETIYFLLHAQSYIERDVSEMKTTVKYQVKPSNDNAIDHH